MSGSLWDGIPYTQEEIDSWDAVTFARYVIWQERKGHHPKCHGSPWDACGCVCNCGFGPPRTDVLSWGIADTFQL